MPRKETSSLSHPCYQKHSRERTVQRRQPEYQYRLFGQFDFEALKGSLSHPCYHKLSRQRTVQRAGGGNYNRMFRRGGSGPLYR